jgi:hypothetical protein
MVSRTQAYAHKIQCFNRVKYLQFKKTFQNDNSDDRRIEQLVPPWDLGKASPESEALRSDRSHPSAYQRNPESIRPEFPDPCPNFESFFLHLLRPPNEEVHVASKTGSKIPETNPRPQVSKPETVRAAVRPETLALRKSDSKVSANESRCRFFETRFRPKSFNANQILSFYNG